MGETIMTKAFKQFDIVTDYSDHHYNVRKDPFATANSEVRKKIMQEWNILEKNLPETIFVRAYEGRIDLLRAAIIGANATPYHDNIFFFDITFPIDYPNKPPLVYYHSHGLRLNPNLYENGYVCLSLLNTWNGNANERWVPSKSTILQVLVSIQGLVLNDKPFFNEPGYRELAGWQDYNRNTFVLSCKTILFNLKNPPKNFEDFVRVFFRHRAKGVLKACDDYINGRASVGYTIEGSFSDKVPHKFKSELKIVYEKLEVAFNEKGNADQKQGEDEKSRARKRKGDGSSSSIVEKNEVKIEYFTRSKAAKVLKVAKALTGTMHKTDDIFALKKALL